MTTSIVAASNVVTVHDITSTEFIQTQPKVVINNHLLGSRINSVTWSFKNQLVASAADDGQIILSLHNTGDKIQEFQAYPNKVVPVTSVQFSNGNEFLASGLLDGSVKIWDLQSKQVARVFRPLHSQQNPSFKQAVTSVQFNPLNNDMLGASTSTGHIYLYPMADLMKKVSTIVMGKNGTTPVPELLALKASDSQINQFKFSPFMENILASAQDDGLLTLYDTNAQTPINQIKHVFKNHTSSVRGITFSPANKLLMASASMDKCVHFYDIVDHKKVSTIRTEYPLQSITFNTDGHTVAVGTHTSGLILVYDLRKAQQVLAVLDGHKGKTINTIAFKNADPAKSNKSSLGVKSPVKVIDQVGQAPTEFKTMEQIREEARRNVELKKKKLLEQQQPQIIQEPEIIQEQIKEESPKKLKLEKIEKKQAFNYEQKQLITEGDIELFEQLDIKQRKPIGQGDYEINEQMKIEINKFIQRKYEELHADTQRMINDFHIEIIRQFEIQRNQVDSLIHEYLIDEEDEEDLESYLIEYEQSETGFDEQYLQ